MDLFASLFDLVPLENLIFLVCWLALAILGAALLVFGLERFEPRQKDQQNNRRNLAD
jgi:hypothetical protein